MRDDSWRTLNDEALERLLIERWLLRGASLAVILVAAIGATYLGLRGVETVIDQVTVGLFLDLAAASGVAGFTTRPDWARFPPELRPFSRTLAPSTARPAAATAATSRPVPASATVSA